MPEPSSAGLNSRMGFGFIQEDKVLGARWFGGRSGCYLLTPKILMGNSSLDFLSAETIGISAERRREKGG